jgi:endonuclease/exonuclease/phosphatase family metal-dependent hydrolase
MQSWKSTALALILAALLTTTAQTPASAGDGSTPSWAPRRVGAMTLNMYIGADVDPVFAALQNPQPPCPLPCVVAQVWDQFLATNIAERVEAMARLIRILRPDLIGVQEATLVRIQIPSAPTPATDVAYDFRALLLAALKESGLGYRAVAQSQNLDLELPADLDGTPTDIRVTDRDVILARGDVKVDPHSITKKKYDARLQVGPIALLRGFVAVDATVRGNTYRFVNTHLEPGTFPPPEENIRVEQVKELTDALDELDEKKSLPLIVVGDFNSAAPDGDAYRWMRDDAGYADVWTERVGAAAEGFTCCQDSDLLNQHSLLDERIDLIFAKNVDLRRVIARTGLDKPWQKTASGLWPSDHGAVFASILSQGRAFPATQTPDAPGPAARAFSA